MRVLLVPEVYRRDDASANGTLRDAVAWVERWLAFDDGLHVYWLLPPRDAAGYDREGVRADRERVTLVEAETLMGGGVFTDSGYTTDQLRSVAEVVYDQFAYLDAVVDQLRSGRADLRKWLLAQTDHWAAQVAPFSTIAHVHDLQLPFKYRWCDHRDDHTMRAEVASAAFADGIWFTAGVDADGMREHGSAFLDDSLLEDALDDAVVAGSPMEFDRFDATFADDPRRLHVAGSLWEKKEVETVLAAAERLHDRFGVETVMTSMEPIPARCRDRAFVDAHPEASRATYEAALDAGDLAVCASAYETMARTPFEQAASGQVLLLRDRPWVYDCAPDDYRLVAEKAELVDLAVRAVEHWAESVAETRRLVAHVKRVRDPDASARRTYDDLARRVDAKTRAYTPGEVDDAVRSVLDAESGGIALDELDRRAAAETLDGRRPTERDDYSRTDLVYALRSLGYSDSGNPGTPVFSENPSLGEYVSEYLEKSEE
jgi:hypothetical protein